MELDFAEWITQELAERNMKPVDLARKAGFSATQVSRVLNGTRGAGIDFYQGVARAFRLPLEEVLIQAGILPKRRELPAEAADWGNRLARLDDDERKLVIQAMDAVLRLAEMRPSSRRARRSEAESPESPK